MPSFRYSRYVISREDLGSWLTDPPGSSATSYPGESLGLPQTGRGSVAGVGRRFLALWIDWGLCYLLSYILFDAHPLWVLGIFATEQIVGLSCVGTTLGKVIVGLHVRTVRSHGKSAVWAKPAVFLSIIRTALVCLVVPALIMNSDRRGFHDVVARTVVVTAK